MALRDVYVINEVDYDPEEPGWPEVLAGWQRLQDDMLQQLKTSGANVPSGGPDTSDPKSMKTGRGGGSLPIGEWCIGVLYEELQAHEEFDGVHPETLGGLKPIVYTFGEMPNAWYWRPGMDEVKLISDDDLTAVPWEY